MFTKRAGTGGDGHGLLGSRVVRTRVVRVGRVKRDGLRRVEFGVMTLTRPLTRRVGRDGLGRGGYGRVTGLLFFNLKISKFQKNQKKNSKKIQKNCKNTEKFQNYF